MHTGDGRTRTTPPRPLDVESLFPGLAAHRRTATRLHPRPGRPGPHDSHVGGPLLWPADEPWPVCESPHRRAPEAGPPPLLALAQLHARDVPDLPAGPDGCDLLQVFWCPFDAHGPTGSGMYTHLRWRRAAEVRVVAAEQPAPAAVGFSGYVPEPCVLHPERVTEYPYIELLTGELGAAVEEWEDAQEEAAYEAGEAAEEGGEEGDGEAWPPTYQSDLSLAPGWKAGGHPAWNLTGPGTMDCDACAYPMELLLTVATNEWHTDTRSWIPLEDGPQHPTGVVVANHGKLNVFACPRDPSHPHGFSVQ
ncbi:hypothetical protein [Streptomyces xanthophaeus]|uniref:hypothetical protein n=1 Tax=Streptomyces xanthophaeus TaxID=67385 RepID=UPI002648ACB6|nr:hypothetical protein [Streptomyces xanthophaeus]WKD34545.1 hypothetical protein KO717_23115 [Streptomyces xanthophaeus]